MFKEKRMDYYDDASVLREIYHRVSRMESRIVRGFEDQGVDVTSVPNRSFHIDNEARVIRVPNLSITLSDLASRKDEMLEGQYTVMCKRNVVCKFSIK